MKNTVNERIGCIIEKSGLSLTAFAKLIGVAQTSLRDCVKNNAEPKFSTLYKIIIANPLISSDWLLTGNGSMEKVKDDNSALVEDLKAELNMIKGENRLLREQLGLGERKDSKTA